jgi:serine/threonine-protein kinase
MELSKGEQLDGGEETYEVAGHIGQGGMGVVYRVEAQKTGKEFAAKLLSSNRFVITGAVKTRFLREAQTAKEFESPRLVESVEALRHRGSLICIMELLSGDNLYDILQKDRTRISGGKRVEWLKQIMEGLEILHGREIVHRDLSPKNCLFRKDGTLAVGDFGVARRTNDRTVTTTQDQMGSLLYISPQQREDPHSATFADDVYALGQIAYHLLSGQNPHGGTESLSDLGYPEEIESWTDSLRQNPAEARPSDASECMRAFQGLDYEEQEIPGKLPPEQ